MAGITYRLNKCKVQLTPVIDLRDSKGRCMVGIIHRLKKCKAQLMPVIDLRESKVGVWQALFIG